MAEWQPIETAPKDGTRILVFTVHGEIEISEWYSLEHFHYKYIADNLFEKIVDEPNEGWNSNTPIFWMPLPEPPEAP